MIYLLKSIYRFLFHKGLNAEAIDFSNDNSHPILIYYKARGNSFIINASKEKCVSNYWYSLDDNKPHPYIPTIKQIINKPTIQYDQSSIVAFADIFNSCLNISDIFPDIQFSNPILNNLSSCGFVFPWESNTPKQYLKILENWTLIESKTRGEILCLDDGVLGLSRVSNNRVKSEFELLKKLTLSIKNKGYIRDINNDITACVLIKNDDYRFLIHGGNHRAAVLAALDFREIPLTVRNARHPAFINYNDAKYWPNVLNNTYTEQEAKKIFDRVFDNKP